MFGNEDKKEKGRENNIFHSSLFGFYFGKKRKYPVKAMKNNDPSNFYFLFFLFASSFFCYVMQLFSTFLSSTPTKGMIISLTFFFWKNQIKVKTSCSLQSFFSLFFHNFRIQPSYMSNIQWVDITHLVCVSIILCDITTLQTKT